MTQAYSDVFTATGFLKLNGDCSQLHVALGAQVLAKSFQRHWIFSEDDIQKCIDTCFFVGVEIVIPSKALSQYKLAGS